MEKTTLAVITTQRIFCPKRMVSALQYALQEAGFSSVEVYLSGRRVKLADLGTRMEALGKISISVTIDGMEVNLIGKFGRHCCLHEHETGTIPLRKFHALAEAYATDPNFVMALIRDWDYDFWQNMDRIEEYELEGVPHEHLSKIPNTSGRRGEHHQMIDVKRNPGYWEPKDGYLEGVAAHMWLGKHFWGYSAATEQQVLDQRWLVTQMLPTGVMQIRAADLPFRQATGEQGELQHRLKKLLFKSAEGNI